MGSSAMPALSNIYVCIDTGNKNRGNVILTSLWVILAQLKKYTGATVYGQLCLV